MISLPPQPLFLVFLLCSFLFIDKAYASRFSGAYSLHVCEMGESRKEIVDGGHTACQAYISGVIDYHNILRAMKIAPAVDICIPESAGINDLHDIVLVYLRKNSEHDNFIAAPVVVMALYEVFPCK